MQTPVPAGPHAVRWLRHEVPQQRAGSRSVVTVEAQNAGSAAWRGDSEQGVQISYHWLDLRGNPIVWAGIFTPVFDEVSPGAAATLRFPVDAPIPPGRYRLAIDLVDEGRAWFAELGNTPIELDLEVAPRIAERTLAVRIGDGPTELIAETRSALTTQEEPIHEGNDAAATAFLAPGCRPEPDWSRRLLDAHAEGYAAVGGSVAVQGGLLAYRSGRRELDPWKPGFGRSPGWELPLLCPSVVSEALEGAPFADPVCGLPALDPSTWDQVTLCDGRITVSIPARALTRVARPSD